MIRQQELLVSSQEKAKQITENIKKEDEANKNKKNIHRDFTKLKNRNSLMENELIIK